MKKKIFITFLILFITTLAFTLYSKFSESKIEKLPGSEINEKFNKEYLTINSCEKLDSLIIRKFRESGYDTALTVRFIDEFLRNRFYHSYSEFSLHDNWMAALMGHFFWKDFFFPVVPCDIIQYPMAACSQQGILFQRQLDLLNIRCSTIKFYPVTSKTSGHYAVSVYYDNSWHYYDPNQEPVIVDGNMPGISEIIDKKLYEKMYVKKSNIRFQDFFKNKSYIRENKVPFSKGNMYYFHAITAFLSNWLWLILLPFVLLLFKRKNAANVGS